MKPNKRGWIAAIVLITLFLCVRADARCITDMTGRKVAVPETIRKVYGASPPATLMVYAMDPGLMAGLNFPFNSSEKQYLNPHIKNLSVIGGWFGQGRTANLETLLAVRPDIILMNQRKWESAGNEKIEKALKPLGIPIVYMVLDHLADYPKTFHFLGELFNRKERARLLERYAATTLEAAARLQAAIPDDKRVSVYYAEGPDGFSTECHTSVHAELIPFCSGRNIHQCEDLSGHGMQKVSMEQLLIYNPKVIIFHEPLFPEAVHRRSEWKNIHAVRNGRLYRIPCYPFNWFDRPPSFMRLLGAHWLMNRLYPEFYPIDMITETRSFYHLFLQVDIDEIQVKELLQP